MKRFLLITVFMVAAAATIMAQDATKKNRKETVTFFLETMECDNCVRKIERNIAFEKGVTDLKCDLKTQTVTVTYRVDKTDEAKLADAFRKLNYDPKRQPDANVKPAAPMK